MFIKLTSLHTKQIFENVDNYSNLLVLNTEYAIVSDFWNYSSLNNIFSRLYYITHGEAFVSHQNKKYHLLPGKMYLIPAYTSCNLHCSNSFGVYYIHFCETSTKVQSLFERCSFCYETEAGLMDLPLFKRILELYPDRKLLDYNPKHYTDYEKGLMLQFDPGNTAVEMETNGILYQLLSRFMVVNDGKNPVSIINLEKINKVIKYINQNLHEKITVQQLSKLACLNTEYFSKWFASSTGVKPIEYINRKKIQEAQRLLTFTDGTLSMIASQTGFFNHSHLIKVFRKYMGITPSEYRKLNGNSLNRII